MVNVITRILVNASNVKSYGIINYTKQLIKHLHVIYPHIDFTLLTTNLNDIHFSGLEKCQRIKLPQQKPIFMELTLRKILKKFNFSMVHSVGNYGFIFCPIPQIITIHDTYEKVSTERFNFLKRTLLAFLINYSGKKAAGIIAVSRNTLNDINRFYPALKKKGTVIYSGVSIKSYKNETTTDIINRTSKENYIFVGTLEPGKNLSFLLKAISILKSQNHFIFLRVIGAYGWKQNSIYSLIKELRISDNVVFLGQISDDELVNEYRQAKALIFPSLYEGFGFPVIEAMKCGCPVIAAKNSAIPEAGGDCALYFDEKNVNDLIDQIRFLEKNPEKIADLILKAFTHSNNFSWRKTAEETYNFYLKSINSFI